MCPYDAKKAMIQQKMSPEATQAERDSMTIEEVTTILKKVFQEKNLGNRAITDDGEKGFYMGGSNKGRCHGCGKQGHYIANCPDKKGSNRNSGQGRFGRTQGPTQKKDHRNKVCFLCKKKGHIRAECRSKKGGKGGEQANLAKTKKGYEMTFVAVEGLALSICHSTSSQGEEEGAQSWCIGVDDDDMYSFGSEESKAVSDGSIPDAFFDAFETFVESDPEEEDMPEWQETRCERAVKQEHSGMNYPIYVQSG
jgi:hypothetical protein